MKIYISKLLTLLVCLSFNTIAVLGDGNENTIINLMVVYTEDARKWADENRGGIDNVIAQGIAISQTTFDNSEVGVELNLVFSGEVEYEETGDSRLDLRRLRALSDGYMVEVHEWRDLFNADLVKLLTYDGDVGGVAYLPRIPNENTGFSLTRVQAASWLTFPHEIGHNLGCHHSRNQQSYPAPPGGGMFEYSTGWRWQGVDGNEYVSVMTYPNGGQSVPIFSNPDINWEGTPTGSYTGEYAPADNARSIREVKKYIAGYRGPADIQDSLIVVEFYNNTNGHTWQDKTNWLTDEPLRNWSGLDVANRIFRIDLFNNSLSGSIPPELGNLSKLNSLWLWGNDLSGSIPPELVNLSELTRLDLSNNNLSGSIHIELGNLSELRTLMLHSNELSGSIPKELGNLSELRTLWLQSNELSGSIPPELVNLSELTGLGLSNNNLSGSIPPELGNISELTELYLNHNSLSGSIPPEFGNLSKLWTLRLHSNELNGSIPKELGNLSELRTLRLNSNELSGSIPPELGNLSELIVLYLNHNSLNGSIPLELGYLSELSWLWIHNNNLRGALPLSFTNLENLNDFRFYGTKLCVPSNEDFLEWFNNIETVIGTDVMCDDVLPDIVEMTLPENNSMHQPLQLKLQWEKSDKADTYRIQVSKETDFSNSIVDTSGIEEETFFLTGLRRGNTYYWRVQAIGEYIDSDWSEVWSFTTTELDYPVPVTLVLPEDETLVRADSVKFLWLQSNPDVKSYKFILATDHEFNNITADTLFADTTIVLYNILYDQNYWWRVQASNEAGSSEWSNVWSFTTLIAEPGVPLLSYPPNDTTGVEISLKLQWKETERAESYHLQLSESGEFASAIIDTSNLDQTELKIADLEHSRIYYWRVKAANEGGESDWSEIWQFTTDDVTSILADLGVPPEYILLQNYPNPFNPSTVIRYGLPERSHVILTLYNYLGQRVTTVVNQEQEARYYEVTFDASHLPSGVYIYRLQAGEYVESRKMLYLK